MAYQLKSNPLDNNPLFAGSGESQQGGQAAEQEQSPKKKPRGTSGKQAKQPKKQAAKSQNAKGESAEKKAAEQPAEKAVPAAKNGSDEADRDAYTRATFIVRRDLLEQLKDYAFTERREIKEVINEILAAALEEIAANYQKDGRTILNRPE